MEKIPSLEKRIWTKEEVVAKLKEKTEDVSEGLKVLDEWLDNQEKRVEKGEITSLQHNIEWAELYRDAGLLEMARESFEQALEQAWHERDEDTYRRLQDEILKLDGN